jgi:hypothetical protein
VGKYALEPSKAGRRAKLKTSLRTVNSDSNTLVESVSISTNKCRDLSKFVYLKVFCRDTFGRLSLDNLKLNVVGLRNCTNGSGAGITLREIVSRV